MLKAWVVHTNKVFWVESTLESPVQKLIFNIFEKFKDHSFFILRNPIFTSAEKNPTDHSFCKLSAKTIFFNKTDADLELAIKSSEFSENFNLSLFQSTDFQNSKMVSPKGLTITLENAKEILTQYESQIPRGQVLHDYNRQIVAILSDASGNVEFVNSNFNYRNKILHAEFNLVNSFLETHHKPVPASYKIFVSLKPCRMCADFIWSHSEPNLKVYYLRNDPGRLAQGSQIPHSLTQI